MGGGVGGREGGRKSYIHLHRALVTMESKERNRKRQKGNLKKTSTLSLRKRYRPYRAI